jgi:hypothetical protein
MITVIIPTFNAMPGLPATLAALAGARASGLISDLVVSDAGSTDATTAAARAAGARIVGGSKGRGGQLKRGAAAARSDWLLFLHADTVLEAGWDAEARAHLADAARAGVFRLAFDAEGLAPRLVAAGANLRTRIFKLPYGDQGLLVARALYDAVGGYADQPLFEDVDIVDRIVRRGGRRALRLFRARARTSAARYERRGYARQVLSNWRALVSWRLGAAPEAIARRYEKR